MSGLTGVWGHRPPRKPRVGAGRAALAKRAKAKGGGERKRSAAAARRGLSRGGGRRRKSRGLSLSQWGPAAELLRFSRLFEQKFLNRQRLRTLVFVLAGAWIAWTFLIGDASFTRLFFVRQENVRLEARIDQLTREEAQLRAEVQALEDPRDRRALERVARDEHAMVREGEKLVRFYAGENGE